MKNTRLLVLASLLLAVFLPQSAQSQVYRPSQRWSELRSPHFRIVYKAGEDSVARASARILESQYGLTSLLTGGRVRNHPVVLNSYNDLSNGYVTTAHFRTEVEVPPIKGKNMNPRTGGWLETVLPHELVHAQNMEVTPGPGVSWFVRLFSPDYGRSMNGAAHGGFIEGIAVYHESQVQEQGGRGNLSSFTQQFDTYWRSEGSSRRWGLGQSISPAGATWPRNRHYIGGYPFARYLNETYGPKAVRDVIDFHSRWPFFGFGVALWHQTGDSPQRMNRRFDEWYSGLLEKEQRKANNAVFEPLPLSYKGAQVHRPVWISDQELLFYGTFYNETPGLWMYHVETGKHRRLKKTSTIEDFIYSFEPNTKELLYSLYVPHSFHSNRYHSQLVRVKIPTGEASVIEGSRHHFAPSHGQGGIHALTTDLDTPAWVWFDGSEWRTVLQLRPNTLVQISANPASDDVAVLANINGLQAVWIVDISSAEEVGHRLPDIGTTQGSILDVAWNPTGDRLLLTIDWDGTTGLYELDPASKRLDRFELGVNVAMEGSYSLDGSSLAFVYQIGDELLPAVVNLASVARATVSNERLQMSVDVLERERLASHLADSSMSWPVKPYRTGLSWLKPRTMSLFIEEKNGVVDPRVGVTFRSSELLQRQSYALDLSMSNQRMWYSGRYMNTLFYPGFIVEHASKPLNGVVVVNTPQGSMNQRAVLEDRVTSLTLPFYWMLHQNVSTSVLLFRPELQLRSLRAFDASGKAVTDFNHIRTLRNFSALYLGVERAIRDLQYRKGAVLFADNRYDLETYAQQKGRALRLGLDTYWPLFAKANHGLHVRTQMLTQAGGYFFGNENLTRNQFDGDPYDQNRNLANLQLRYAVPLAYPDYGGLLVPFYLERSYFVFFSNTVAPFGKATGFDPLKESRTSIGVEWRFVTGFPNFRIDIGVGIGYEMTRNRYAIFVQ